MPDNGVEAVMMDPSKRFFGQETWPVFHDYYMWAKILSEDDSGCHNYVRPENHSFEILVAWRGYNIRGHYMYVSIVEMQKLRDGRNELVQECTQLEHSLEVATQEKTKLGLMGDVLKGEKRRLEKEASKAQDTADHLQKEVARLTDVSNQFGIQKAQLLQERLLLLQEEL